MEKEKKEEERGKLEQKESKDTINEHENKDDNFGNIVSDIESKDFTNERKTNLMNLKSFQVILKQSRDKHTNKKNANMMFFPKIKIEKSKK